MATSKGGAYVLVHQAGLADPAVSEDNDLRALARDCMGRTELQYLEKDLLP
jgi:hypothetical protein